MIRNHSLGKNFRRLKVLNKHLAKYLHFFSFLMNYIDSQRYGQLLRLIGYSTLFEYLLFIQTVVCSIQHVSTVCTQCIAEQNGKIKCEKYSLWVVVDYFILRSA